MSLPFLKSKFWLFEDKWPRRFFLPNRSSYLVNCAIVFERTKQNIGTLRIPFLIIVQICTFLIAFAFWQEQTIALAFGEGSSKQQAAETLIFQTANGPHEFKLEVMRTHEELEKGLMFRRYLPADRGMLFDFQSEQPIAMWMKNTFIPLDMIFISRHGDVTSITENAEPLSETIIPSNGPVYAVLEVNGGTAGKIGLKIGDHAENPIFKP